MRIRTYQGSHHDQSPTAAAALGTLLPGSRYCHCVARSLNRSRVVAREGTCIYPAGGVPISSRAPAHGRLALGGPIPKGARIGGWRDEAVPRCDHRSLSRLGELLALRRDANALARYRGGCPLRESTRARTRTCTPEGGKLGKGQPRQTPISNQT